MVDRKEILSRLKLIGHVKSSEKLNVKHLFVQPDNWITSIKRTWITHDTRENSLKFISQTLNKSFTLLYLYSRSKKKSEREICRFITEDLKKAKIGICNLKSTYSEDIMFCCTLDTLIQDVDSKLKEFVELNPCYNELSQEKIYQLSKEEEEDKEDLTKE